MSADGVNLPAQQLNSVKMKQKLDVTLNMHSELLELRSALKAIVKDANNMTNSAKEFQLTADNLFNSINSLPFQSSQSGEEPFDPTKYTTILQKYEKNRVLLVEQLEMSFEAAMVSDEFIRNIQERQKKIKAIVKEYDQLHRKIHLRKSDSNNALLEQLNHKETQFHAQYEDYYECLTGSLENTKQEIKQRLCSFMYMFMNFSITSGETSEQIQALLHGLTTTLQHTEPNKRSPKEKTKSRSKLSLAVDQETTNGLAKEGYIHMRVDRQERIKDSWKLRWVVIRRGNLLCFKRWKSSKPKLSINMLFISVKSEFCFESNLHLLKIVSPEIQIDMKAPNFEEFLSWKSVLEAAVTHCYKMQKHSPRASVKTAQPSSLLLDILYKEKENQFCADCSAENPDWACMNIGVIICHDCSGIHRSLGVHISKVRSVVLDRWTPSQSQIFTQLGNKESNAIWESEMEKLNTTKPEPSAKRIVKQQFILAKYVEKKFITESPLSLSELNSGLARALEERNFLEASKMLIFGANINMMHNRGTLLHNSVQRGDVACVEFLLQRDCQPNLLDEDECTPLDRAILSERKECAQLLTSRGAEVNLLKQNETNDCTLTRTASVKFEDIEPAHATPKFKVLRTSSTPDKKYTEGPHRLKRPLLGKGGRSSLSSSSIPKL